LNSRSLMPIPPLNPVHSQFTCSKHIFWYFDGLSSPPYLKCHHSNMVLHQNSTCLLIPNIKTHVQ